MAIFPQRYFTQDQVAIRTGPPTLRAPYKAASINQAFCGRPKGVYRGFEPSAAGSVLTLNVGPEGYSIAKVDSQVDKGGMDVKVSAPVMLDFTSATVDDFLPNGVQVILRVAFYNDAETQAQIFARKKTGSSIAFTVDASPETLDLSTLQLDAIVPGSLTILVDAFGLGATSFIDTGAGVFAINGALPGGGTLNYEAGLLTGVTLPLSPFSNVIVTYTRAIARNEVQICRLTGNPLAIAINDTPPADRDVPIAYDTVPFGYMPAGSVEDLAAAFEIVTEVNAARVDLQGTTWPNLKARLDHDLGGEAMALRLGKVFRGLRSNQYQAAAGVSQVNVSGSLSEVNRDFLPALTLSGDGSETQVGAICDPVDTIRNVCTVFDAISGDRLIDNSTSRTVVFGRLRQEDDFVLDGAFTFSNASTVVVGDAGTRFTLQLEVGDTIQAPDGKFYEVASITTDASLTLRDAYQAVDATSGALVRRRFLLKFRRINAGVESDFTLTSAVQIQFFLPAFVTHSVAAFDASTFAYKPGERPVIPDATTSVQGKVALADVSSPYVGSVNLQVGGAPVAGGPFHTLNFTGATGSLVELSPGEVDVTAIGPIGPAGPGGGPGPTGLTGDQGISITQRTPLEVDIEKQIFPGPDPIVRTFTVNFGYTPTMVSGGIAQYRDGGVWSAGELIALVDISVSGTSATITLNGQQGFGDHFVRLCLDACGYF